MGALADIGRYALARLTAGVSARARQRPTNSSRFESSAVSSLASGGGIVLGMGGWFSLGNEIGGVARAAVNLIQCSAAQVPWMAYEEAEGGVLREVPNHRWRRMLEFPGPGGMTRPELVRSVIDELAEVGVVPLSPVLGADLSMGVTGLTTIPRSHVMVSQLMPGEPCALTWLRASQFRERSVFLIRNPPPGDPFGFLPRLHHAMDDIELDASARKWLVAGFNSGFGATVFSFDPGEGHQGYAEDLVAQLNQQGGGSDGAGKAFGASGLRGAHRTGIEPQRAQIVDFRRDSLRRICAHIGVPSVLLDASDSAVEANMLVSERMLATGPVADILGRLSEQLSAHLRLTLGNRPKDSRTFLAPQMELHPVIRRTFSASDVQLIGQRADVYQKLRAAKFSPETAATMAGVPVPEGDAVEAAAEGGES